MVETEGYLLFVPLVVAVLVLLALGDLRSVAEAAVRAPAYLLHAVHVHLLAVFHAAASWFR